jgi:hypothetical protein
MSLTNELVNKLINDRKAFKYALAIKELSSILPDIPESTARLIYDKMVSIFQKKYGNELEEITETALTKAEIPYSRQVSVNDKGVLVAIGHAVKGCHCADIVVGSNIRIGARISDFGVVSLKTTCRERWTQDAWTKIHPPRFYYLTTASRDYPDNDMFRESDTRKIVSSTPKRRDGRSFKLGFEDLIPELKMLLI